MQLIIKIVLEDSMIIVENFLTTLGVFTMARYLFFIIMGGSPIAISSHFLK